MDFSVRRKWLLGVVAVFLMGVLGITFTRDFITPEQVMGIVVLALVVIMLGPGWSAFSHMQNRAAREFVDKVATGVIDKLHASGQLPLKASKPEVLFDAVVAEMALWGQNNTLVNGIAMVRQGVVFGDEDFTQDGNFLDGAMFAAAQDPYSKANVLLCAEITGRLAVMDQYEADDPLQLTQSDLAEVYEKRHRAYYQALFPSDANFYQIHA